MQHSEQASAGHWGLAVVSPRSMVMGYLYGLHHEGCNVCVCLELGFKGTQVIVGDVFKARHEGPKAPKALGICRAEGVRQMPVVDEVMKQALGAHIRAAYLMRRTLLPGSCPKSCSQQKGSLPGSLAHPLRHMPTACIGVVQLRLCVAFWSA